MVEQWWLALIPNFKGETDLINKILLCFIGCHTVLVLDELTVSCYLFRLNKFETHTNAQLRLTLKIVSNALV